MKRRGGGAVWWVGWRACAAMGFGAVVAVAVAYVGAVNDDNLDFGGYGDGDLFVLRQTNRWWDVVTCVEDVYSADQMLDRVRSVKSWESESGGDAEKGRSASSRPAPAVGSWPRDVIQIGWPARCFWGIGAGWAGQEAQGAEPAPEWIERYRYVRFPLPRRVLWSGLMIDAAVFGAPVLALVCVPTAVRRVRRRAKGLCLSCGYDLKGQGGVCPECGRAAS